MSDPKASPAYQTPMHEMRRINLFTLQEMCSPRLGVDDRRRSIVVPISYKNLLIGKCYDDDLMGTQHLIERNLRFVRLTVLRPCASDSAVDLRLSSENDFGSG